MTELTAIDAQRTIVTSALPYIHGLPHLGNIVGSMLPADLYHRFLDVRGHPNIYICGSDEHGTPLELSALEAGESPEEHADKQHAAVKDVVEDFDLDFTLFGRTHTGYNEDQTQSIFSHLYENGYINEKTQSLPYSPSLGRFLPDRYIEGECPHCGGLARGDQCDDCGKLLEPEELIEPHDTIEGNTDIEFQETNNLFLDLPAFRDDLKDWLADESPLPSHKQKEVINLLGEGLEERCITRDIEWGFDIPWEELGLSEQYDDKVFYVWFDAPIGYIGITRQFFDAQNDESRWEEYWRDPNARTVYSIGKDNTIFHSIIFPSMLMGGGPQEAPYNLPDHIFIHEYLLSDDVQFSKSRGTGLSTDEALDLLEPDYWRFYLATALPETHDTRFSWSDLEQKVNKELNDNVGNFVNRVLTLAEKWFDNQIPQPDNIDRYADTRHELQELVRQYDAAFEQEKSPKKALQHALAIARLGDEFISAEEPWHHDDKRADVIYTCLQIVDAIAVTFYPYTPRAAERIAAMMGRDEIMTNEDDLAALLEDDRLAAGTVLGERQILFEKIDADELEAAVETGDDGDEDAQHESGETMSENTISFDQFQDMDFRTATVTEVAKHPNADKLYLVQLDVGGETKQSCAGLRPHFAPDELVGRQVIVVNNLEPTELRGETSECMMLAVDTEDEDVVLLTPAEAVSDGLKVR